MRYAVLGAGDVGCAVGLALAAAGHDVIFLGRESPTGMALQKAVSAGGATLKYGRSWQAALSASACAAAFSMDPSRLAEANVILLACKRVGNSTAASSIAKHAKLGARVVALQNGVGIVDELRHKLQQMSVTNEIGLFHAIINFNIVRELPEAGGAVFLWTSPRSKVPPCFQLPLAASDIATAMDAAGLMATTCADMEAAAYGKLIVNVCGNAINALSGLPIREMLRIRGYRALMVGAFREVQAVLEGNQISYDGSGGAMYVRLLSLPGPLVLLATSLIMDPRGKSSMWGDLQHNRRTEVDVLNGVIVELGKKASIPTPINARLQLLVHAAEAAQRGHPNLTPAAIADGLPPGTVDVADGWWQYLLRPAQAIPIAID